jgi:hypothetical protein
MDGDILFILILLLSLGVLIYLGLHQTTRAVASNSQDAESQCPSRAQYTSSGFIVAEPGGKVFTSLDSYMEWYKYLGSRGLECSFVSPSRDESLLKQTKSKDVDVLTEEENTYALTPIKKLDDYEFSRVFSVEKESRNQLERVTVDALTARRQFDWSQLPFNSQVRTDNEQPMNQERLEGFTGTVTEPFFQAISGDSMAPQDLQDIDEREKAILQQYAPRKTEDLMEHETDDVQTLVKKLYETDPDWDPVVEKVNKGEFQVTKLIPKRKKQDEQYDDERVPTVAEALHSGDATGVPHVQPRMEVSGMQDPFFDKRGVIDYEGDHFFRYENFAKWTPGLERMFAPTLDQNDWIGTPPQTALYSEDLIPKPTQMPYHVSDNSVGGQPMPASQAVSM